MKAQDALTICHECMAGLDPARMRAVAAAQVDLQALLHTHGDEGWMAVLLLALTQIVAQDGASLQLTSRPTKKKGLPMLSGEELDHTPLTFGQYKGQTPSQIAEHDPQYLVWLANNVDEDRISKALLKACKEDS